MINLIRNQEKNNQQLRDINTEQPVAALHLQTNADRAITTAGTIIEFGASPSNLLFTWSGTDITIPNDGMYLFSFYARTSINIAALDLGFNVIRSGITYNTVGRMRLTHTGTFTQFTFTFTQYFNQNDVMQIVARPTADCTILFRNNVTGSGGQSGVLHMVQLTGAI